jgi:hypothetical protein
MNFDFDVPSHLLCSLVGLCVYALAALRAGSVTKEAHDAQIRANRTTRALDGYRYDEYCSGGLTYCLESGSGSDGLTRLRVFDSSGRLQFAHGRWVFFCLFVPNLLLLGLSAGVEGLSGESVERADPSVLASDAPPAVETPPPRRSSSAPSVSPAVRDACDWRGHIARDGEIEERAPTGYHRDFWPNGAPRSIEPLVEGRRHGLAHYTHADGVVYGDIPWRDGKKHGVFTLYREDGSREQTLSYRDGVPYGLCEWFAPDGRRTSAAIYLDQKHTVPPQRCENGGM